MFGTTHHELSAQLLIQMDAEHSDCGFLGGGGVISLHYGFHSTIQYKAIPHTLSGSNTNGRQCNFTCHQGKVGHLTFQFTLRRYQMANMATRPNKLVPRSPLLRPGSWVWWLSGLSAQNHRISKVFSKKFVFWISKFSFLNLQIPVLYRLGTHHSSEFKPNTPGRPLVRVI